VAAHADADTRPRIAVRFRGAANAVEVPIVRLEQRADGRWYALVQLGTWSDGGGTDVAPWDEPVTIPPGHYEELPGEDYAGLKRVRFGQPR
jgi:hypothetical protein